MKRKVIKGSLLSLALSLSMIVNMSVPAFAESIPEEIFADELFYLYPTLVFYSGNQQSKFAVGIPPEDAGKYRERVRTVEPAEYLIGFHRGAYDNIFDTFDRMRQSAGSLLDEGSGIGDEVITVNIIDQLIEENRDNFITKILMKVFH